MTNDKPMIKRCFFSKTSEAMYKAYVFETFEVCNCPAFIYRNTCRHIKELKEQLEKRKHPFNHKQWKK